jgi:hypothetical protein
MLQFPEPTCLPSGNAKSFHWPFAVHVGGSPDGPVIVPVTCTRKVLLEPVAVNVLPEPEAVAGPVAATPSIPPPVAGVPAAGVVHVTESPVSLTSALALTLNGAMPPLPIVPVTVACFAPHPTSCGGAGTGAVGTLSGHAEISSERPSVKTRLRNFFM